jgi:HEAT repeat protein
MGDVSQKLYTLRDRIFTLPSSYPGTLVELYSTRFYAIPANDEKRSRKSGLSMAKLIVCRFSLSIILVLSVFAGQHLWADDDTKIDEGTLRDTVLYGTADEAIYATARLFKAKRDKALLALLNKKDLAKERRLVILQALRINGRERPIPACEIVQGFLNAKEKSIRLAARQVIVANEPLSPPQKPIPLEGTSYQFLQETLFKLVQIKRPSPSQVENAKILINLLEAKQDPVLATNVLISVFAKSKDPFRSMVEKALWNVTGVHDVKDWNAWFQREKRRNRSAWLMRRIAQLERSQQEEKEKLEKAAANVFSKLVLALSKDDQALMTELRSAVLVSVVEAVRLKAIRMLGELGRKNDGLGEEAVTTLKKVFQFPGLSQSIRLETVKALGSTGRKSAVKPLKELLKTSERDILLAILQALATLKQPEAIKPLKNLLTTQLQSLNPDVMLVLKTIQGLERIGLDPEGEISRVLISTIEAVRTPDPKRLEIRQEQRQSLLQAGASALGQLDYELESAARKAVDCLAKLSDYADPSVRFFVADSLSRIKFVDVRKYLDKLSKDKALTVRSTAVRGLGRCGLRPTYPKDVRREIIYSLIEFFLGPDKDLQPIAQTGLQNLIKEDFKKTLANLTMVIEAFDKKAKIAFAMPFLEALEREEKVSKDVEVRYHWLLEARARSALTAAASAPQMKKDSLLSLALGDARYLSKNPRTKAKERYRRLEAQGRLALGEGQTVCQLLAKDGKYDESWELWKKGLAIVQKSKQRAVVRKLMDGLNKTNLSESKQAFIKGILDWLDGTNKAPSKPKEKKNGGKTP